MTDKVNYWYHKAAGKNITWVNFMKWEKAFKKFSQSICIL